ncbi:MAG: WD40 repeat domain-containing protein [Bacteroidia bacterium]|nr:WD40 repeat domain-containing protein [Bacteroidia bacterium]
MKKIELTHDILAEEVYNSSSALQRMRREAESRIEQRFLDYQNNAIPLSAEELNNFILPYLGIVDISENERSFVLEMDRKVRNETLKSQKKRKRILIGLAITTVVFTVLSLVSIYNWKAAENSDKNNLALSLAYQARNSLSEGRLDEAYSFADSSLDLGYQGLPKEVASKVLSEIYSYPLVKYIRLEGYLISFGFYRSGESFYTIDETGKFLRWSVNGKREDSILLSIKPQVAQMSEDNSKIALFNENDSLLIYDFEKQKEIIINIHDKIHEVKFSENGKYLLIATKGKKAILQSLTDYKSTKEFEHNSSITSVNFIPVSGKEPKVVSTFNDSTALVWSIDSNFEYELRNYYKPSLKAPLENSSISENGELIIINSPKGDFILSSGYYKTLVPEIDDIFTNYTLINTKFTGGTGEQKLISITEDSLTLFYYDFSPPKPSVDLQLATHSKVLYAELSPQDDFLMVAFNDNQIILFEKKLEDKNTDQYTFKESKRIHNRLLEGRFSYKGDYFISKGIREDKGDELIIWKADELLKNLEHPPNNMGSIRNILKRKFIGI